MRKAAGILAVLWALSIFAVAGCGGGTAPGEAGGQDAATGAGDTGASGDAGGDGGAKDGGAKDGGRMC